MPASLPLSLGTLLAFLLVLARVTGAIAFVPIPGFATAPGPPKVALALGLTIALFPHWPRISTAAVSPATLMAWAVAEAGTGIAIGTCVVIVLEACTFAAQVLGLQAGYAYAQTIDPDTQADAGILLVLAQLMAGLFFFALGLDRAVVRLFAVSLDKAPPGAWVFGRASGEVVIRLISNIFSVGLRLALPIVALLIMVDVALALLGRLNSQLQLLSLAFPAKMLIALGILSSILVLFPRVLGQLAATCWTGAMRTLGM